MISVMIDNLLCTGSTPLKGTNVTVSYKILYEAVYLAVLFMTSVLIIIVGLKIKALHLC